jgi:Leucine-rich repeat (LRR) protein
VVVGGLDAAAPAEERCRASFSALRSLRHLHLLNTADLDGAAWSEEMASLAARLLLALPSLGAVESLTMPVRAGSSDELADVLQGANGLTRLTLHGFLRSRTRMRRTVSMLHHRAMQLAEFDVIDAVLPSFWQSIDRPLPWQRLSCEARSLTATVVSCLVALTSLVVSTSSLEVHDPQQPLTVLRNLTGLRVLRLSANFASLYAAAGVLTSLVRLERLGLEGSWHVSADGLRELSSLSALRALDIPRSTLLLPMPTFSRGRPAAGDEVPLLLTRLQWLRCGLMTASNLSSLASMHSLTFLDCGDAGLLARDFLPLRSLSRLRRIRASQAFSALADNGQDISADALWNHLNNIECE